MPGVVKKTLVKKKKTGSKRIPAKRPSFNLAPAKKLSKFARLRKKVVFCNALEKEVSAEVKKLIEMDKDKQRAELSDEIHSVVRRKIIAHLGLAKYIAFADAFNASRIKVDAKNKPRLFN
ncbi:MAG: hypothetical protein ABIJ74_02000 [archaeon]